MKHLQLHHPSPPEHPSLWSGAEHLLFRGDDQFV